MDTMAMSMSQSAGAESHSASTPLIFPPVAAVPTTLPADTSCSQQQSERMARLGEDADHRIRRFPRQPDAALAPKPPVGPLASRTTGMSSSIVAPSPPPPPVCPAQGKKSPPVRRKYCGYPQHTIARAQKRSTALKVDVPPHPDTDQDEAPRHLPSRSRQRRIQQQQRAARLEPEDQTVECLLRQRPPSVDRDTTENATSSKIAASSLSISQCEGEEDVDVERMVETLVKRVVRGASARRQQQNCSGGRLEHSSGDASAWHKIEVNERGDYVLSGLKSLQPGGSSSSDISVNDRGEHVITRLSQSQRTSTSDCSLQSSSQSGCGYAVESVVARVLRKPHGAGVGDAAAGESMNELAVNDRGEYVVSGPISVDAEKATSRSAANVTRQGEDSSDSNDALFVTQFVARIVRKASAAAAEGVVDSLHVEPFSESHNNVIINDRGEWVVMGLPAAANPAGPAAVTLPPLLPTRQSSAGSRSNRLVTTVAPPAAAHDSGKPKLIPRNVTAAKASSSGLVPLQCNLLTPSSQKGDTAGAARPSSRASTAPNTTTVASSSDRPEPSRAMTQNVLARVERSERRKDLMDQQLQLERSYWSTKSTFQGMRMQEERKIYLRELAALWAERTDRSPYWVDQVDGLNDAHEHTAYWRRHPLYVTPAAEPTAGGDGGVPLPPGCEHDVDATLHRSPAQAHKEHLAHVYDGVVMALLQGGESPQRSRQLNHRVAQVPISPVHVRAAMGTAASSMYNAAAHRIHHTAPPTRVGQMSTTRQSAK